ncbi:MAG: hypothetical protein GF317_10525 [Candidatus Lokiarchaeota archaeon]|nr:hypothetical protein [Candidatus Lokiarchaeota archaeon]MBD3200095.1 hypothetical protein [Candidatus Lokiarchaeota archaeon]
MKKIDLVFRTVGERTTDIALEFAKKNIKPEKVHLIENVKPFSKAMQMILKLDIEADFIVFMDADCIILENMRPFLDKNAAAYVDCFVLDKFRGKIHTGVHITRRDVFEEMKRVKIQKNDMKYLLRPESRRRNLALEALKEGKQFKRFRIFHDFFQNYRDIYVKYALRELRSRTEHARLKLNFAMENWHNDDFDYVVAREAVKYARSIIKDYSSPQKIENFIKLLPEIALKKLKILHLDEKKKLKMQEVLNLRGAFNAIGQFDSKEKIFCIGLGRTGTKSLTAALDIFGYNIIHYPHDLTTFEELSSGDYNLSILQDYDGISDITISPYYPQLDKEFPNSKFILTVRDKESWLKSFEKHWSDRPPFDDPNQNEIYMKMRRLLRASVYGTYKFNRDRMGYIFDLHTKNTLDYFKDKPEKLLVLNIFEQDSFKKLCSFLNVPEINNNFPDVKTNEHLFELL